MVAPYTDLESAARQSAQDFIDLIVREAKSAAEVPAVLQKILFFMHQEWTHVDWNQYADEFGGQSMPIRFETHSTPTTQVQGALAREFLDSLLLSDNEDDS